MAVKKTERTNQGVYQATLVGPKPKMEKLDNWPWPKMYVEFEISGGAKVTWSEDVGKDLFYLVRALTGTSLPTNLFQSDNQTVFNACTQALVGASFTGLVRVNKDGWIDQLAVPGGPQLWRFVDIQTTTREGIVTSIEVNDTYNPGEKYSFIVWRSEIVSGKYSGYAHSQFLRLPKFSIDEDGDLMVDDRAALYKFLMETGVGSMEDFRFNQDCDNIWPMTQHLAQKAAEKGCLFHGTAFKTDDKKAGGVDWNTLMAADASTIPGNILPVTVWDGSSTDQPTSTPQAPPTENLETIERLNKQVSDLVNVISGKLGLDGTFVGEPEDMATAAWTTLLPSLFHPAITTLEMPEKYGWPPMSLQPLNWGEVSTSEFVEILLHFSNMPNTRLGELVLDVDAMNQEIQDVLASPPVAVPVQQVVAQPAPAVAMMGSNEVGTPQLEVEEDAIPF